MPNTSVHNLVIQHGQQTYEFQGGGGGGGAELPVGIIVETVCSTCPFADGTWVEVVRDAPTWAQVEAGIWSYSTGTGTGTIHYWKRTA